MSYETIRVTLDNDGAVVEVFDVSDGCLPNEACGSCGDCLHAHAIRNGYKIARLQPTVDIQAAFRLDGVRGVASLDLDLLRAAAEVITGFPWTEKK